MFRSEEGKRRTFQDTDCMGERRMLTAKVTDADAFVSMPSSAQALYLHLNMGADDDGFNNQVQLAMFKAHASVDDVKLLLAKRFILQFESGVIVIKHWRMANALRNDRYKPTNYQEELSMLKIKDNKAYTFNDGEWLPNGCQTVAERLPNGCPNLTQLNLTENKVINTYYADEEQKKPDHSKETDEIIGYLNSKVGTHYRNVEANRKLISGRLNDGYTVEDFKKVIDKKCDEWMHTDMQQFLRPKTLFAPSNFESYLNAPPKIKTVSCVVEIPEYIMDQMTAQSEHEKAEKSDKPISEIKAEIEQMKGNMHE